MATQKKYLHDRLVLLLLSINSFLAALTVVSIGLRLASVASSSNGFIVQYRANLGISAYKTGSQTLLLSFIFFALIMMVAIVLLSRRVYPIRRQIALTILSLGGFVLAVTVVVSNAILALH